MATPSDAGPSSASTIHEPQTPENSKPRRKSWFNLGSPSLISPKDKKDKRNSIGGEDLELGDVGSSRQGSITSIRQDIHLNQVVAQGGSGQEELLTIDGDVETIKKKKKRRSKDDQGSEALRMEDFSPGRMVVPDNQPSHSSAVPPFSSRQFSRTASNRTLEPTPWADSGDLSVPLRSSSLAQTPAPNHSVTSVAKSQPLIPLDRPLPPLPDASVGEPPPNIPREIVVTPSSPMKVQPHVSLNADKAHGERRSSTQSRSRSTSRSRSAAGNRTPRGASIGLGLPFSRRNDLTDEDGPPPPVPIKNQTVSSPLPSRSGSPVPLAKITFAQAGPDVGNERGRPEKRFENGKEKVVKRARSLSGLFGGKPPSVQDRQDAESAIDADLETGESASTGTAKGGVLEWLGVKKPGKRRPTDPVPKQTDNDKDSSADEIVRGDNANKIGDQHHGSAIDLVASNISHRRVSDDAGSTIRPPFLRSEVSSTTVVPLPSTGKLANLFSRRATRTADLTPEDAVPPIIPSHQSSRSSQSSLVLPPVASTGSFYISNPGDWASTPTSEAEETLFSPGSGGRWGPGVRPWMDNAGLPRSGSRSALSSPLESLPEQGPILEQPVSETSVSAAAAREGRLRSMSDAPRLVPSKSSNTASHPDLYREHTLRAPSSFSPQVSPGASTRPSMGNRSNSGNSAILVRVKSVFKSSSRNRSNSLLQNADDGVNEFGALAGDDWLSATKMRPSSSSPSSVASPGPVRARLEEAVNSSMLGLTDARRISGTDQSDLSPRTSYTPSMSSFATGSTRYSTAPDYPHAQPLPPAGSTIKGLTAGIKGRVRASTVSNGPTSYIAHPPPSPDIFPLSATPPRRRPSSIRRLSTGLFGGAALGPSPKTGSLFPLPPRSSGSISSSTGALPWEDALPAAATPGASPRPSTGSLAHTPLTNAFIKAVAPNEAEGETPEDWLDRIAAISRSEIANVLAVSGDDFHTEALRIYMSRFDFTHHALDVALRRLLMHMSLPRETQQIDRVIEAFATRYEDCEPGSFVHKDRTYVLAFSMMMLHTDAFNRNNKNKMSKADYVRNTRMEGVPPLVLEAFFDNITFTPFVFIEDDSDFTRTNIGTFSPMPIMTTAMLPTKSSKLDIYHLIVRNQIHTLRVDVERDIPAESPMSCLGTRAVLDSEGLHRAFARACTLRIVATGRPRRKSSAGLLMKEKDLAVAGNPTSDSEMSLKVTKVGLLSRKDDVNDGGKKSTSRKWKSWSVILTNSQLIFFKDQMWALSLLDQINSAAPDESGQVTLPRVTTFKPDEVFPVQDCIALFDRDYSKYPNTFRFIMPHGRQYLMQAPDEDEMNEWLTLINYASAFKTAGVKIRGDGINSGTAVMAGAAAAASHRRDVEMQQEGFRSAPIDIGAHSRVSPSPMRPRTPEYAMQKSEATPILPPESSTRDVLVGNGGDKTVIDIVGVGEKRANDGEQLEEVFGVVKAELAAGRGGFGVTQNLTDGISTTNGTGSGPRASLKQPHRKQIIKEKIQHLQKLAEHVQTDLISHLRLARNFAVLCPFQRSTRERIEQGIPTLAVTIRDLRIQQAKLSLWIHVLRKDIDMEDREFARVRHVALQAANRSLKNPEGVKDVNAAGAAVSVPTLSLPEVVELTDQPGFENEADGEEDDEVDDDATARFGTSPGELPVVIRRPSDDIERPPMPTTMPSGDYLGVGPSLPATQSVSNPLETASGVDTSGQSTPMFSLSDDPDLTTGNDSMVASSGHEDHDGNFSGRTLMKDLPPIGRSGEAMDGHHERGQIEQAEDWQNTRAARRVSLANVAVPRAEMRKISERIRRTEVEMDGATKDDGEKEEGSTTL